jgi:hypothetical protein
MDTQEFTCGQYTQNAQERRIDIKVLRILKQKLENTIPNSKLLISDATEWNNIWKVPIVLQNNSITEHHFMVVRGYGASLHVEETFGGDQGMYAHFIHLKKTKRPFRAWTYKELAVGTTSILAFLVSALLTLSHVSELYGRPMGHAP